MSLTYDPFSVPEEVRNKRIAEFHVEFLRYGPVIPTGNAALDAERQGKKKNHCIFRLVFAQSTQSGHKGAHIRMDVEPRDAASDEAVYHGSNASDEPASVDGRMTVKVVKYANPSNSTIKSFRFNVDNGVILGHLLDVALHQSRRMDLFKFAMIDGSYMGCRDWITQYFHQLVTARLVEETSVDWAGRTFNNIICNRYSPTGGYHGGSDTSEEGAVRINYKPVDMGFFTVYQRVVNPSMRYDPSPS